MFTFHPLSEPTRARLIDGGVDPDAVAALVRMAVAEDLAGGIDVTSVATVPAEQRSMGTFGARRAGTLAGLSVAAAVIDAVCGADASDFDYLAEDGDDVAEGTDIARVEAPTRLLLTAERSALNLLCHLSGVATLTRRWADALQGSVTKVRDTRKTTPGLRFLEKYAVRCGGGSNHRMALSDAALVKDNHVLAAGGVAKAFAAVRALAATIPVEIEVDSLDGQSEAMHAGADLILLDNFTVDQMRAGVAARDEYQRSTGRRVVLEASGGLSIEMARAVGETGVDYVAVGGLTHSAPVLDIGLDLRTISA
jgi:nicotinate-nucleotide pyrophosphorylase (carboxylating)